ncbi:PDZ domain-containing protein [Candidatus Woesearchaeota archaeon]|nr:MAG: PDZ domain-containing protein [Candidatus Woesearchaeota archaeon]
MSESNLPVILFYGGIILLLILFRKKFEIQNKIIALYRTKIGLKAMENIGTRYAPWVRLLGYIGIGAGFIGMLFIIFTLVKNLYNLLLTPAATSGISLVIPGVNIPGSPITPPLIIGWIALFFVIVIHEFSHGIVSIAHGVKVKSSGIVFFGPLMGAFVEPDEKQLEKKHETAQYSVFAAGPWSNILLAVFAFLVLSFALNPLFNDFVTPAGVSIEAVEEGLPAAQAGLPVGSVVTAINGYPIQSYDQFIQELRFVRPGESVTLTADGKNYTITTTAHPNNERIAFLGIKGISNKIEPKYTGTIGNIGLSLIKLLRELFSWIGILSLGIGLANLLPLGPVDGGRMMLLAMQQTKGKKRGLKAWIRVSTVTLLLLLLNLFWPAISWFTNLL